MRSHRSLSSILLFSLCSTGGAGAADIQVLYTEIPGSPTSVVPGAVDAGGSPTFAEFIALEDLNVSHDGTAWMLKARTDLGTTADAILILGGGDSGTMFAQEGQPFQGGQPGEQYEFFDSLNPVSFDENGRFAFSARAKNGLADNNEKLILFDGVTHNLVLQRGDPALGLLDIPTNVTGDEEIGNSIGSVFLRNDGKVGFVNTPIQNCSSFRYPAFFLDNTGFQQSGVNLIGGETWDSFSLSGAGGTPDGLHWFAIGDTEASTSADEILAVDGVVEIREGSAIGASTVIADDVFHCRMLTTGDWLARGDQANADDWAVRNGVILAKTGDPVTASENYGASFNAFIGNRVGDWLLTGTTDNPNADIDSVMVFNGQVVAREGDPIDVDGNGLFDDNAFLRSFQTDDAHLTDDGVVYFLATLRDVSGTLIGDAFLKTELCGQPFAYGAGCPGSGGFVPALDLTGCPRSEGSVTLSITGGLGGATSLLFLGIGQTSQPVGGGCLLLVNPLPAVGVLPLGGSGAGNGSISVPATIPMIASLATIDLQAFVLDGGVPIGFANTNGLEVPIVP